MSPTVSRLPSSASLIGYSRRCLAFTFSRRAIERERHAEKKRRRGSAVRSFYMEAD